jgi:alpha-tubulin suppressor-like RCC1 family protein
MASELLLLLAAGKPLNVWAWGVNEYGMNGQNTLGGELNSSLTLISTAVSSVGLSSDDTAGYIKTNGTLWGVGGNISGNLGTNNTVNYSSPVQVGVDTNWTQASFGDTHSLFRKSNGTLWATGNNSFGQLGTNYPTNYSSPIQIGALTTWTFAAAGAFCSFAIKGGALWAWGLNDVGQLGRGPAVEYSSPVQVGTLTTWSKIFTGNNFNAGITTAGALWSWGLNSQGQLGNNTIISTSSPVQVSGGGAWSNIAFSLSGTCGIKTNGTLWQWGVSYAFVAFQQQYSSPVQIGADTNWANVYSNPGGDTYVAIKTNGTAWVWGKAIPAPGVPYTPIPNSATSTITDPNYLSSPVQIGSATNWASAVVASTNTTYEMSLYLLDTSNNLYSVGYNSNGILGINKVWNNTYTSPIQITQSLYSEGSCSAYNSLFIKKNRTLWESGAILYPYVFAAYIPAGTLYSSPVQIGLDSNWSKVFANCGANFALTTSKDLYAWGRNQSGQLGRNNTTFTSAPVQIPGTWELIGQSNSNCSHTLGYKFLPVSGVYGWGSNTSGQLGVGDRIARSSPVLVGNITSVVKKIYTNSSFSCFITAINELYVMGDNFWGQLGQINRISRSFPTQVGGLYNDVSLGDSFAVAVKTDGTLWAWGLNSNGQLGQNNSVTRSSPVQIGLDSNWQKVFAGGTYWAATKSDDTVWACGSVLTDASPFALVNYSSPVQIASNFKVVSGNASSNFNLVLVRK